MWNARGRLGEAELGAGGVKERAVLGGYGYGREGGGEGDRQGALKREKGSDKSRQTIENNLQ